MIRFTRRAAAYLGAAIFVLVCALAGCGGGGTNGVAPTVPRPNQPAPGSPTVSLSLTQSSSAALPTVSGISSSITLTKNNAPAGAMLTVSVSTGSPAGVPTIPANSASAFEYFSLTSSATVTFNGFPKFAMTLPSAPSSQGQFYAWMYNSATKSWTDLGTMTVSGSSLSFGGGTASVTLAPAVTYVVIPFTATQNAACPTPSPKIFVENKVVGTITEYDEQGNQVVLPSGAFPNVVGPGGDENIAFDPFNGHLYITFDASNSASTVHVYDQTGHQITTTGSFPNLLTPIGIAFDTSNHRLYVPDHADGTVKVFDEDGNPVATSGTFTALIDPDSIAFDPLNNHLYVGTRLPGEPELSTVNVYDEDGHQITTSGTFPNLFIPEGIAFDSSNQLLYVVSNGDSMINVYDQNGNAVSAFPVIPGSPFAIAFDASNHQLYVTECCSQPPIEVFDQSGTRVSTSGTFPNASAPFGIAVVP